MSWMFKSPGSALIWVPRHHRPQRFKVKSLDSANPEQMDVSLWPKWLHCRPAGGLEACPTCSDFEGPDSPAQGHHGVGDLSCRADPREVSRTNVPVLDLRLQGCYLGTVRRDSDAFLLQGSGGGLVPCLLGCTAVSLNEEAMWVCCLPEPVSGHRWLYTRSSTHTLPSSPAKALSLSSCSLTLGYTVGLSGTKLGCGEGGCGACTVMLSKYDHLQNKIVYPLSAGWLLV